MSDVEKILIKTIRCTINNNVFTGTREKEKNLFNVLGTTFFVDKNMRINTFFFRFIKSYLSIQYQYCLSSYTKMQFFVFKIYYIMKYSIIFFFIYLARAYRYFSMDVFV